MVKKLYLHVGTPKTGTSAIQKFCLWNREVLREFNYAYPTFPKEFKGAPEAHNGYFLTKRIKDEEKIFEKCMAEVLRQFDICDNVILSDENMWKKCECRENLWTDLMSWAKLHKIQVKVIVYLRRQDEYAVSLWAQRVKVGHWDCSTDTFEQWLKNYEEKEVLDYAGRIEQFVNFFGRENVIVRKYARDEFENGDVFSDFLKIFGLKMDSRFVVKIEPVNISLKGNPLEIKRVLNSIPEVTTLEHRFFRDMLFKCMKSSEWEGPTEVFSLKEKKAFLAHYEEGNTKIQKDFFPEQETLFSIDEDDETKWKKDNSYMLDDVIRFAGVVALYTHRENEMLRNEILKIRHPFQYYAGRVKNKLKNCIRNV